MKKKHWLVLFCFPALVFAGIPRPPCTFHGMVKDQLGQPYLQNARVVFSAQGEEVAHYDIDGLVDYGINLQASIEMDSGSGESYAPYALVEGDPIEVTVLVDGVQTPTLESGFLTTPAPGTDVSLNLTTGTDSDGDGLPDEWEQQMMAASGGAITNIAQILPGGDFDGDGASNLHEYRAGTFAFLDYDYFAIDDLEKTESGRFLFRFLSVPGKSYQLEAVESLTSTNGWAEGSFALAEQDPATLSVLVGDGYYRTLFIEVDGSQQFMRLITK